MKRGRRRRLHRRSPPRFVGRRRRPSRPRQPTSARSSASPTRTLAKKRVLHRPSARELRLEYGLRRRRSRFYNGARRSAICLYAVRYRTFVTLFFTTRGLQFHWLDFDARAVRDALAPPLADHLSAEYEQLLWAVSTSARAASAFGDPTRTFSSFSVTRTPSGARGPTGRRISSTTRSSSSDRSSQCSRWSARCSAGSFARSSA